MKCASLLLFLVAAAFTAAFTWARRTPSVPALAPPSEESPSAGARREVAAEDVENADEEEQAARIGIPTVPPTPAASAVPLSRTPASRRGILEGLVARESAQSLRPVASARVTLYTAPEADGARCVREQEQLASTFTAADGSFRFSDLLPGRYGVVAFDLTEPREAIVSVGRSPPPNRATLLFGCSRVHGTVRDESGAPLANCRLRLEAESAGKSRAADSSLREVCRTNADGRFAFEALPVGRYHIVVSPRGRNWKAAWPERRWEFRLVEGQELRLNAGSSQGAAHWRGFVRSRTGDALESGGKLELECRERDLTGGVVSIRMHVRYSPGGAFDALLDPGSWMPTVGADAQSKTEVLVESGIVDAEGLQQDIFLP